MSDTPQDPAGKKLENVIAEKTGALCPGDSVETAGDRMRSMEANAWPVVEGRKLVGTIDHPDPDHQASGHGHDPRTTTVGDTMTRTPFFCYEDQDASEAQRLMIDRNLNHLPVVDREMRVVGILCRADVAANPIPAAESAKTSELKPPEATGESGSPAL
jgi:CBS domain-containing protein